jgi:hypothetical protein
MPEFQNPADVVSPKVKAVGVTGALGTLIAFLLLRFAGVEVPADVALAIATVLVTAFGYFVRDPLRRPGAVRRSDAGESLLYVLVIVLVVLVILALVGVL